MSLKCDYCKQPLGKYSKLIINGDRRLRYHADCYFCHVRPKLEALNLLSPKQNKPIEPAPLTPLQVRQQKEGRTPLSAYVPAYLLLS